ncbi:MAG: maleylacetoacetate isomerase [Polaribacter sp.]|jgi:maleylacetoacetate isomerase
MITLYGYWRSTAAYRVRIALNLKKIDYSQVSVHLVRDGGEQHKEDYQCLNPQGLVPTLKDGDFTLSQSIAILEYLDEKFPEISLLPIDLQQKALVRQLSQIICADLHPLNNLRVLKYLSNNLGIHADEKTAWYHYWLKTGFDAYEAILDRDTSTKGNILGDYSMGGELTMADTCLIPQLYNARRFDFCLDNYPRLTQIEKNCLSLPCFKGALPESQPDAVIS